MRVWKWIQAATDEEKFLRMLFDRYEKWDDQEKLREIWEVSGVESEKFSLKIRFEFKTIQISR